MFGIYNQKNTIILMGSFPPPIGGVSVYLDRLYRLLSSNGYKVLKWDISKGKINFYLDWLKFFAILFLRRDYTLHLHALNTKYLVACIIIKYFTNAELILTNHNVRFLETCNSTNFLLLKILTKKLNKLIVVNPKIIDTYKENGFVIPNEIKTLNAFLPPPIEDENKILDSYSEETLNFFNRQNPILISNAYKISFYNNKDLYGLDLCIELTSMIKETYPSIGFVFALANSDSEINYLRKMKERIFQLALEENFHFISNQQELWPLIKMSDLMIRATNTDGDSVSIREALYLNCPVVASDIVSRPNNCTLFRNRDISDLFKKVNEVLNAHVST